MIIGALIGFIISITKDYLLKNKKNKENYLLFKRGKLGVKGGQGIMITQ